MKNILILYSFRLMHNGLQEKLTDIMRRLQTCGFAGYIPQQKCVYEGLKHVIFHVLRNRVVRDPRACSEGLPERILWCERCTGGATISSAIYSINISFLFNQLTINHLNQFIMIVIEYIRGIGMLVLIVWTGIVVAFISLFPVIMIIRFFDKKKTP